MVHEWIFPKRIALMTNVFSLISIILIITFVLGCKAWIRVGRSIERKEDRNIGSNDDHILQDAIKA